MRLSRGTRRTVGIGAFVLGILADGAIAHGQQGPPRLSASIAGGMAVPLNADFDFNGAEWQVAVRGTVSPRYLLEGFFDEWRHSSEDMFPGGLLQGPSGTIGSYGRVMQHTVHTTRALGFNALFRGSIGRVSFTGGGGPGYLVYHRTFSQELTDCQASVAQVCDGFQNRWTSGGFSVQGLVGAEAPLWSRVSAFAQVKFTGRVSDFSGSHTSATGGVRVAVW